MQVVVAAMQVAVVMFHAVVGTFLKAVVLSFWEVSL